MPAPTSFSLPISGSAPDQVATKDGLEGAVQEFGNGIYDDLDENKADLLRSGKLFLDRADAEAIGQENLPSTLGLIGYLEGDYYVLRRPGSSGGQDNLFATAPYWSLAARVPAVQAVGRRRPFYGTRAGAIAAIPSLIEGVDDYLVTREGTAELTRWRRRATDDPLIPASGDTPAAWGIFSRQDSNLVAANLTALQGVVEEVAATTGQIIGYKAMSPGASTATLTNMHALAVPVARPGFLRRATFDARIAGKFTIHALTRTNLAETEPVTITRSREFVVTRPGIVTLDVSMPVEAGEYLAIAGDTVSGLGYTAGSNPGHIPWFSIAIATLVGNPVSSSSFLMHMRFEIEAEGAINRPSGVVDQRVSDVRKRFSGLTSTTVVTLGDMAGSAREISGALTHADGPVGNQRRYDLVVLNRLTDTLAVIEGDVSSTEAEERQPVPTSFQTPVARVLVGSAGIVSVEAIGATTRGVPAVVADSIESQIDACRRGCPRFMAKVRRGAPVRIGAIGDSITNIRNASPGETDQINGINRDAGTQAGGYFEEGAYSSGFLSSIPLYTSLQLGRGNDGGGPIHTRVGMVWELVAALEDQGHELGSDLWYDNAAIGGTATADAWDSGTDAPTPWLTLFGGLGADLSIVAWGMNERGNTATEGRLIKIGQYLKDQGSEVIFVEVPRPRTLTLAPWRYTNAAIRRAAAYLGTGAIPLSALGEDTMLGYLGVNSADLCAASTSLSVHPGFRELGKGGYGRLFRRLVE